MKLQTPPELPGIPLLGNALAFNRNRGRLLRKGYEAKGSIFTIRPGTQPVIENLDMLKSHS